MALPKKKNNPDAGMLKDAKAARDKAEIAERLRAQAERQAREAQQLRVEGEEGEASRLEQEASELHNEYIQQATEAGRLHKKAARRATVEALAKTPFGAGMQYVKSYGERFINITNPMNRLQDVFASFTPFGGAFGREKSRLMGDSRETEIGIPFAKIGKQIEESNVLLNSISRSQVKLIEAEKATAIAVDETTHRVEKTEGATRDVQIAIVELRDVLVRNQGGVGSWPDFGEPGPTSPSVPPMLQSPAPIKLLAAPDKMTPLRPGPASASNYMKMQTDALLQLVDLEKKQLDEMREGDDEARLREARARGDGQSNMQHGPRPTGLGENQERRGGGFMGLLSGIASAIGGFFTARVLPIFARIGQFFAPLGRMLAPLGRMLGLGGVAAGAAGVAGGIMRNLAGAGAAARGGAGVVARAASGGLARRVIGFLPGVGSVLSGMDAVNAAREGNWTGAALHGAAAVAGVIPGLGPLARLGIQAVAGGLGHATNAAEGRTATDRRLERLERPQTERREDRPAPNIITTNNHYHGANQTDDRTVIAQSGKSIIERSRGDLFAYTA